MADQQQELAVREKRELATKEEKTVPGRFFVPNTDVYETEEALTVVMEVPGVKKSDLDVQVKGRTIRISGAKAVGYPERAGVHRRERLGGRFDRALTLPIEIDAAAVKAECRDGILALLLPRAAQDKPKTIRVN